MKHEYTTIKVWTSTRKSLKLIAAETGESMVEVIDRLVTTELKKQSPQPIKSVGIGYDDPFPYHHDTSIDRLVSTETPDIRNNANYALGYVADNVAEHGVISPNTAFFCRHCHDVSPD